MIEFADLKKGEIYVPVSNTNSVSFICIPESSKRDNFANIVDSSETFSSDTTFLILEPPTKLTIQNSNDNFWTKSGMQIIEPADPFFVVKTLATGKVDDKKIHTTVKNLVLNKHLFFSGLRKLEE